MTDQGNTTGLHGRARGTAVMSRDDRVVLAAPDYRAVTNNWLVGFAGFFTIALLTVGAFCSLSPDLLFHDQTSDTHMGLRYAGVILGIAAVVAANVWIWSVLGPRIHRDPAVTNKARRVVLWAIGLTTFSLVIAGWLYYVQLAITLSSGGGLAW